jgi:nucleolar protein 12
MGSPEIHDVQPVAPKLREVQNKEGGYVRIQRRRAAEVVADNKDDAKPGELHDPEVLARTAFVGNVPVSVKRKELRKLFKPFGDVESVRLRGVVADNPHLPKKTALLARRMHKNCETLLAYVVFKSPVDNDKISLELSDVLRVNAENVSPRAGRDSSEPTTSVKEACAALNLTIFQEKHLRVTPAAHTRGPLRQSIFLGNLPFDVTEEELIMLFQPIADTAGCALVGVRVTRDKVTGMGRGVGFASFDDELGVRAVLNMGDELKIKDRVIRVERAAKEKKRNSKTAKRIAKTAKLKERKSEKDLLLSKGDKKRRREKNGDLGVTRKIRKQRSERKTVAKVKHAARKARQAEAAAGTRR